MTKAAKPLLEDKLVTWKRAYEAVLAELSAGITVGPVVSTPAYLAVLADLRVGASRTAAILIQGVEHDPARD